MEEVNVNGNEPQVFSELPKEQRKALQTEFFKTSESKKIGIVIFIIVGIFAAFVIASVIIGMHTKHQGYFATPTFFVCVLPAIIRQQKFEKWLADEKNIIMKRKK